MKIKGFITHKQAEFYSDCADYFAVNRESRKIAVSDGISQSFSPSEWSRILVESYIEEKWAPEQDLKPLQSQWLNEVRENLKKLQEQGAVTYMMENMIDERESAGATFCGLSFDNGSKWTCNVLGDSALIKLSENSIEILSSQEGPFNNRPDYFDSYASQSIGEVKAFQGELRKGDVLFVVSDPFSELFQKSLENKTEKQIIEKLLAVENQEDFCLLVGALRADYGMHNDDSTLVIVEYDGTKDFNIEQIAILDELIENERQKIDLPESISKLILNDSDSKGIVSETQIEAEAPEYNLEDIRETARYVFCRCKKEERRTRIKGLKNSKRQRCTKKLRNSKEKFSFDYFWDELIKELKF